MNFLFGHFGHNSRYNFSANAGEQACFSCSSQAYEAGFPSKTPPPPNSKKRGFTLDVLAKVVAGSLLGNRCSFGQKGTNEAQKD